MRRLPRKRSPKQSLIISAVGDYFGEANPDEKKSATRIALWLMNRRKGIVPTEEEIVIKDTIKANIQDGVYSSKLVG